MKKALRFVTLFTGIISVASAVVLGFLYLEDIYKYGIELKNIVSKKFIK